MTKQDILDLLRILIPTLNKEAHETNAYSYIQQRAMINRIFCSMKDYDIATIMLRLTVIDSLYSTNASYSYFSIEEMAQKIIALGSETDAEEYFYGIACGEPDTKGLFKGTYGIRKNLGKGSKQPSLLSKYADYVLLQKPEKYPLGFPIYDKLAAEMYPVVCERLGFSPREEIKNSIEDYVAALDELRAAIFDHKDLVMDIQQFDALDAYLWRMGKINNGNYSLLLYKEEYEIFIRNLSLVGVKVDKPKKFEEKVNEECRNNPTKNILNGINNDVVEAMLEHWKKHY